MTRFRIALNFIFHYQTMWQQMKQWRNEAIKVIPNPTCHACNICIAPWENFPNILPCMFLKSDKTIPIQRLIYSNNYFAQKAYSSYWQYLNQTLSNFCPNVFMHISRLKHEKKTELMFLYKKTKLPLILLYNSGGCQE